MIRISRWRSCLNTPPKKDGEYLVVRFYKGQLSYGSHLGYTTKYGWNTHMDSHDYPIKFDTKDFLWAEVTKEVRKRK